MATVSVAEMVVQVGIALRDNITGRVTQDSTQSTQFTDTSRITQTNDIYVGSEIFFPDLPADMTGPNPNVVSAFDAANGRFTLRQAYNNGAGALAGTRYVLMNLRGRGKPVEYRLGAIRQVVDALAEAGNLTTLSLGAGISNQYQYVIPAGLDTLISVQQRTQAGAAYFRQRTIRRAARPGGSGWSLGPGRVLTINDGGITNTSYDIILTGRSWPTWTGSLSATYNVQTDDIVRQAQELLTTFSPLGNEQAGHNALLNERMRSSAEYWYANEERIY